jgi:hypothetical protein
LQKFGELMKMKGGATDDDLKNQLNSITTNILNNQTESLKTLSERVSLLRRFYPFVQKPSLYFS